MGELEKKTVATHAREPGVERDPAPGGAVCGTAGVHGVDVQVGEISFAQRHQVSRSSEVGLKIENFLPPRVIRKTNMASVPAATSPASSVTS